MKMLIPGSWCWKDAVCGLERRRKLPRGPEGGHLCGLPPRPAAAAATPMAPVEGRIGEVGVKDASIIIFRQIEWENTKCGHSNSNMNICPPHGGGAEGRFQVKEMWHSAVVGLQSEWGHPPPTPRCDMFSARSETSSHWYQERDRIFGPKASEHRGKENSRGIWKAPGKHLVVYPGGRGAPPLLMRTDLHYAQLHHRKACKLW